MNRKVKYQVFVSSTYEDLKDERKEVSQAILEVNCIPAGMELFPAASKDQWSIIKHVIDESDIYLVVVAGRYGSVGTDDEGNRVSYTEMEFDYAKKIGKPIIALLHRNPENLPRSKCEKSQRQSKKLEKFRNKVSAGRLIQKWDNKDNLKSTVMQALYSMMDDDSLNLVGWVKATDASRSIQAKQKETPKKGKTSGIKKEVKRRLNNYESKPYDRMNQEEKIAILESALITAYYYPEYLNSGRIWKLAGGFLAPKRSELPEKVVKELNKRFCQLSGEAFEKLVQRKIVALSEKKHRKKTQD